MTTIKMKYIAVLSFLFFSCTKEKVAKRATVVRPLISVQLLLNNSGGPSNMADGVMAFFDANFSYAIGNEDSYKWTNEDENLAIIKDKDGVYKSHEPTKLLSINGQPLPDAGKTDTVKLKTYDYRQPSYILRVSTQNFSPDVAVFLYDKYMNSKKRIYGVYDKPFTTTVAARADPYRFSLYVTKLK